MKVLSCDTSSKIASVAITEDEEVKCEISINLTRQHSKILMPMVDYALNNSNIDLDEIDRLACCVGPGSFTGIRIAVSFLNAISIVKKKPIISVTSLDSLNYGAYSPMKYSAVIQHARNNQVYAGVYVDNRLNGEYYAGGIDGFIEILSEINESIFFVGNACRLFKDKIEAKIQNEAIYAPERFDNLSAKNIGFIASKRKDTSFLAEPIYLKKSQAERHYEDKKSSN